MKYIKLYEDWHVMPDGSIRETYKPYDVIFDIYNWLDKLEEKESNYASIITRFKKDLDRGNLDPHDLIESNKIFYSEEEVIYYLLDCILDLYKKSE